MLVICSRPNPTWTPALSFIPRRVFGSFSIGGAAPGMARAEITLLEIVGSPVLPIIDSQTHPVPTVLSLTSAPKLRTLGADGVGIVRNKGWRRGPGHQERWTHSSDPPPLVLGSLPYPAAPFLEDVYLYLFGCAACKICLSWCMQNLIT